MTDALGYIELLLTEIAQLDAATEGKFRQAEDREAFDTVCRIERKMIQSLGKEAVSP